jgi:hypothetical protein
MTGPNGIVPGAALPLFDEPDAEPVLAAVAVAATATAELAFASASSHLRRKTQLLYSSQSVEKH